MRDNIKEINFETREKERHHKNDEDNIAKINYRRRDE